MCNFFSCLALKNGDVIWKEGIDSHDDLLELCGISDRTDNPDRMVFARVEILPPNGNPFEPDLSKWVFKIDQNVTPSWVSDHTQSSCLSILRVCLDKTVLDGLTVDRVENRSGLWIRNSKIDVIHNCKVREMWGSSQVGTMWGSSQVGTMWGSSQVREMWGSSQVGTMRGSSQVREMRESSQVGTMRESSQVGTMWESSQVREMRESSTAILITSSGIILLHPEGLSVATKPIQNGSAK